MFVNDLDLASLRRGRGTRPLLLRAAQSYRDGRRRLSVYGWRRELKRIGRRDVFEQVCLYRVDYPKTLLNADEAESALETLCMLVAQHYNVNYERI